MRDLEQLFEQLRKSRFRSRFKLKGQEAQYLREKGIDAVIEHARDFVTRRLAPANPENDGKQTPYKNHPVFIAQHATATCCRSCLEKWHGISKGKALTSEQIDYIVEVIRRWLLLQTGHL
jgi:hypothetical protein